MKRNIIDLMDAITTEDTGEIMDTPLNPSAIHARTRRAIDSGATKRRRFPAALAAAAVAAALCVTAFAADALGAGTLMRSVFGLHGGALSEGQLSALDDAGVVFAEGVTVDGATIRPVAALADENSYYLRLHISAPEGVVIPDVTYPSYLQLQGELDLSAYRQDTGSISNGSFCLPDDDPTDGEKDVVLQYFNNEGWTDVVFNDGKPKILEIEKVRIGTPDGTGNTTFQDLFTGPFQFDIGSNFTNSPSYALNVDGIVFDPKDGRKTPGTLKSLKLSPLGIHYSVQFRYDEIDFHEDTHFSCDITPRVRILGSGGAVLWEDTPFISEEEKWRAIRRSEGLIFTDHIWQGLLSDAGYPDREIPGEQTFTVSGRSMFATPLDLSSAAAVEFDGQIIPIGE